MKTQTSMFGQMHDAAATAITTPTHTHTHTRSHIHRHGNRQTCTDTHTHRRVHMQLPLHLVVAARSLTSRPWRRSFGIHSPMRCLRPLRLGDGRSIRMGACKTPRILQHFFPERVSASPVAKGSLRACAQAVTATTREVSCDSPVFYLVWLPFDVFSIVLFTLCIIL